MGNIKNLENKEAVKKIQEIVNGSSICLFTTNHYSGGPISARPMGTMKVDDDANIWFFSNAKSQKNKEIIHNNRVQLFYANNNNSAYLSIYGNAEIIVGREMIRELWNPIVKTWFTRGRDDEDITIIKVSPIDAYYWDALHNKMVSIIKIITGALTGVTMDDGVEGKIAL